ncbi:MAG TPA: cytochrome c [Casimicrobiaceae bacterium]|nr:cytochrome c [Casimicrobiaceae bacterium]
MKRILRLTLFVLGGVLALAAIAYAVVYIQSERLLNRKYAITPVALAIPTDAASIEEGRRLATLRGCFNGCHGKGAGGVVFFDQPIIARLNAPNLTAAVRKFSDAELITVIRHGVRPDGRSMFVMPSEAFIYLTDEDLVRIIAFLRSLPPVPGPEPSVALGPVGRIGLVTGRFALVADLIARTVPPPEATSEEARFGRYLARTICAQCHGASLRGDSNPDFTSPDLRVTAAYSQEAFARLMRTGEAIGGRDLPTMRPWARGHLALFSDGEIAALWSYLHALPEPGRP